VFQLNLIFAAWIKFPPPNYQYAAIVMTAVLGTGCLAVIAVVVRWSGHAVSRGMPGRVCSCADAAQALTLEGQCPRWSGVAHAQLARPAGGKNLQ